MSYQTPVHTYDPLFNKPPNTMILSSLPSESDENRTRATNFVRDALPLLQCIHSLVQIQPV